MSPHETANILSLLKSLQQDMADVRDHITALELNDRRMTRIEQHLGLLPPPDIPATNQISDMLVDAPAIPDSTVKQVSSRPTASPIQTTLNPLSPGFIPSRPVRAPISAPVDIPDISSLSSTSHMAPSSTQTYDEIQAINAKHLAIENKLDMLANSISSFIRSIASSSFSSDSANTADIDNLTLQDSLFSSTSPSLFPCNSFNISSLNINGLKMFSQNKIELLNDFFSLKHISFGGVVDTHLHPKQVHFLSKRLSNYTVFSSVLDTSQHVRSSGGVSLFIENSLASHVHTYTSLSSRLLSVDLYFKGNVKLRIFVVYIPPTSDQSLRDETIDLLILAFLSDHNPVITYYDFSFLSSFLKPARARQLQRRSRRIFSFDSVTPSQWEDFSAHVDTLCNISPIVFASWHVNHMCEYLHTNIIAGANAILPARTVGNDHTPKLLKDLETLIQHYRFLNRILHSVRLLRKYPQTFSSFHDNKWSSYLIRLNNIFNLYKSVFSSVPVLPSTLLSCRTDNFNSLFCTLSHASKLLRGLHLLKEKEFQDSSIKAHLASRDQDFDTNISSFINAALSRSRRRIVLDRVFIDHPTTPQLLTDPQDISDAVVNHFQHAVPIKSSSPSHVSALPDRWRSAYSPIDSISPDIYSSLLSPPSLEEWLSTVSSMPNGKAPGPSMITYEMLKHLGPIANSLLLILICKCFASANIPDLW
ncbi:hypothetical protein RclHR1_22230003 [Rhizophagus clarus]|uniref:Reverse transcriptase domain-containing protein n=1 Tax=Rhizophagus clarus TaxID=94130 RepID=A0A2Z6QYR8_9GLOM|nr:hypothetical protein RclHR1_22230003 [Rhizophagus clarus]